MGESKRRKQRLETLRHRDNAIPFEDAWEAYEYADAMDLKYEWQGSSGFEKRQRTLPPEQFQVLPVRIRKGKRITMIGMFSKEITKAEFEARQEADRPRQTRRLREYEKWRREHGMSPEEVTEWLAYIAR
jgi:hypothetical protein